MNSKTLTFQSKLRALFEQLLVDEGSQLTKKELRAVDFYLKSPEHIGLSGKDVAREIKVHPSTLVRLAQKLGFKGHPELKRYLIKTTQSFEDARERHLHTNNQMIGNVLHATIAQEIEHLKLITSTLTQQQLDQVCHLILNAKRVYVNGQDNTEGFAEHFTRRLMRSGIDAKEVSMSRSKLAERFSLSEKNDVLILIFNNELSDNTKRLISLGRSLDMQIIGISDLSSMVVPDDVYLIRIYRGETKGTKSVSPSLVVSNAIIRNLTALSPNRTLQGLKRFELIRANVDALLR
ncbi:MurR/RpiR family transcriptional regulator [Vibrio wakamikoensis]|jgi:DNA-binding MurR/RpiR family transcriptional regulator|uniref:MurR/RpiR family transcriptional regulator n=1 Tax=Vibrio chaetopteri TaxID=3016528 RepID=A0AAU8BRH0_9VIBR